MRLWQRFWDSLRSPFSKQDYFDLEQELRESRSDLEVLEETIDRMKLASENLQKENKKLEDKLCTVRQLNVAYFQRSESIRELAASPLPVG